MTIENNFETMACFEDVPIDKLPPSLSPITEVPPEFPEECATFVPCPVCNRTFSPTALQRHAKVCEKLSSRKRHVFDSTKQRSDHLDLHPVRSSKESKDAANKKSRWREKRAEFLRAIRAAKGSSDEADDGEGGRRTSVPSDYIQCDHCQRFFGPKAAERHISWCAEQKTRLPKTHTSEDAVASQRLKTRTKYVPPRPGHSGWRAPKKKDVISSIPPPNTGANITPPGRLISPPPPSHRHISPPPPSHRHISPPAPSHRHMSPPPISPTRRGSAASLPPGPPRYSATGSLGRNAGKQFSALLQSVTGCSPGYGTSSGYGSNALYGTPSGGTYAHGAPPTTGPYAHGTPFNRSVSLRLPRRRHGGGQRMARHRDLASDMMASVCIGGKAKRLEPEGDEAANAPHIYSDGYEDNFSKIDASSTSYDPFSAAERQLEALFGPSKETMRKSTGLLGSTSSLISLRKPKPQHLSLNPISRNRSSSMSGGYLSLSTLGLDLTSDLKSDSSDFENSPKDFLSPEEEFESILSQFSPIRSPRRSPTRTAKDSSNIRLSPTRLSNTVTNTISVSPSRLSPSRYIDCFTSNIDNIFPRISPPRTQANLEQVQKSRYSPTRNLGKDSASLSPTRSSFLAGGNMDGLFHHSPSPERRRLTGVGDNYLSGSKSPSRFRSSLSPTPFEEDREPGDGMWKRSPSSFRERSSSVVKADPKLDNFIPEEFEKEELQPSNHFAWTKSSDTTSPNNSYSRHFGGKVSKDPAMVGGKQISLLNSPNEGSKSIKVFDRHAAKQKRSLERMDNGEQRASSGSSTDSSLPPVLLSPSAATSSSDQVPRFCHECGHKYPVVLAKFCCQCGARRIAE